MALAAMYAADRDALLCDMAQTYGVYDLTALDTATTAALASGLPEDSRVRRAMSGQSAPGALLLLACIADRLSTLVWFQTEDGRKRRNRPPSLVEALRGPGAPAEERPRGFGTPEEFLAARARIIKGG